MVHNKKVERQKGGPTKSHSVGDTINKLKLVEFIEESELDFDNRKEVKKALRKQTNQAEEGIKIFDETQEGILMRYRDHGIEKTEGYLRRLQAKVERLDTEIKKDQLIELFTSFQNEVFLFNATLIDKVQKYEIYLVLEKYPKIKNGSIAKITKDYVTLTNGEKVVFSEEDKENLEKIDSAIFDVKREQRSGFGNYEALIETDSRFVEEEMKLMIEEIETEGDLKKILHLLAKNIREIGLDNNDLEKLAKIAIQSKSYTKTLIETITQYEESNPIFNIILALAEKANQKRVEEAIRELESGLSISIEDLKHPSTGYGKNIKFALKKLSEIGVIRFPKSKDELKAVLNSKYSGIIKNIGLYLTPQNKGIFTSIFEVFNKQDYVKPEVQKFLLAYLKLIFRTDLCTEAVIDYYKKGKLAEITEIISGNKEFRQVRDEISRINYGLIAKKLSGEAKANFKKLNQQEKEILYGIAKNQLTSHEHFARLLGGRTFRDIRQSIKAAKKFLPVFTEQEAGENIASLSFRMVEKLEKNRVNQDYLKRIKEENIHMNGNPGVVIDLILYKHNLEPDTFDLLIDVVKKVAQKRGYGCAYLIGKLRKNEKIGPKDLEIHKKINVIEDSNVLNAIDNSIAREGRSETGNFEMISDRGIAFLKKLSLLKGTTIKEKITRWYLHKREIPDEKKMEAIKKVAAIENRFIQEQYLDLVLFGKKEINIDLTKLNKIKAFEYGMIRAYGSLIENMCLDNKCLTDLTIDHLEKIQSLDRELQELTFKNFKKGKEVDEKQLTLFKKISKINDRQLRNIILGRALDKKIGLKEVNYCLYVANSILKKYSGRKNAAVLKMHIQSYLSKPENERSAIELGQTEINYLTRALGDKRKSIFISIKLKEAKYNNDIKKIMLDYPIEKLEIGMKKLAQIESDLYFVSRKIGDVLSKYGTLEDLEKKKLPTKEKEIIIKCYREIQELLDAVDAEFLEFAITDGGFKDIADGSVYILNALHDRSSGARREIRDAMPPILLMAGVKRNMGNYSATDENTGALRMEEGMLPSTVQHSIDLLLSSLEKDDGTMMTMEEVAKKYKLSHEFIIQYITLAINSTGESDMFEKLFTGNSKEFNKKLMDGLIISISGIDDLITASEYFEEEIFRQKNEITKILGNGLTKIIELSRKIPEMQYIVDHIVKEIEKKYDNLDKVSRDEVKTVYKILLQTEDILPENLKAKLAKDKVFLAIKEDVKATKTINFNVEDVETKEEVEKTKWYQDLQKEEWFVKAKAARKGKPLFSPRDFLRGNPKKYKQPIITKIYDVQHGANISMNVARYTGDERFTRHYSKYKGMGYRVNYIHGGNRKTYPAELVVLSKRTRDGRLMIRVEQYKKDRDKRPVPVDLTQDLESSCVHKIELAGHVQSTYGALVRNTGTEANPDMTKWIADRGCGNAHKSHGEGRKMGPKVQIVATNIKGENYKQNVIFAIQEQILAENAGRQMTHVELKAETEKRLIAKGYDRGKKSVLGYYRGMLVYGDSRAAQAQRADVIIDQMLFQSGPELAKAPGGARGRSMTAEDLARIREYFEIN